MSLAVASGDIITTRKEFRNTVVNTVAYNITHFRVGSVSGSAPDMPTQMGAIAKALYDLIATAWPAIASQDITFTGVTAWDVFPVPRSVGVHYAPGTPVVGAIASEALPMQDSPTILKRTAVGQRWGLGREFFVGLAESQQADGLLTAGAVTLISLYANEVASPITATSGGWTATLAPVLLSGPEDNPTRITPILNGQLSNNIIKTQRRRRPGKGI